MRRPYSKIDKPPFREWFKKFKLPEIKSFYIISIHSGNKNDQFLPTWIQRKKWVRNILIHYPVMSRWQHSPSSQQDQSPSRKAFLSIGSYYNNMYPRCHSNCLFIKNKALNRKLPNSLKTEEKLSEITRRLTQLFPRLRNEGQGWKDSIRHNLSKYPCFEKAKTQFVKNRGKCAFHLHTFNTFRKKLVLTKYFMYRFFTF